MSEFIEVDVNHDGYEDVLEVQEFGDGSILTTADTNGDGYVDMATYDANGDGVFEEAAVDTDYDGIADETFTQTPPTYTTT